MTRLKVQRSLPMRIPILTRLFITGGTCITATLLAMLCGAIADHGGYLMSGWIVIGFLLSVISAAVPSYDQIRKERQRKDAELAAIDAAVTMRVTINDAFDPIVRQVGRIATTRNRQERNNLKNAATIMI